MAQMGNDPRQEFDKHLRIDSIDQLYRLLDAENNMDQMIGSCFRLKTMLTVW